MNASGSKAAPARLSGGLKELLKTPQMAALHSGPQPGLLMLDYDGTLAPFKKKRDEATPYPGVREILRRLPIEGQGRYSIVSGRDAGEIGSLLELDPLPEIWGCHGAQRRLVSGELRSAAVSPAHDRACRQAENAAREQGFDAYACERKACSLALHTCFLPEEALARAGMVKSAWAELAAATGLGLHIFDGGFELRIPGLDKGVAVHALAAENPGCIMVYLGDDITDEDAFAALGKNDLPTLVRKEWRPTGARYWLKPPEDLLSFLAAWPVLKDK